MNQSAAIADWCAIQGQFYEFAVLQHQWQQAVAERQFQLQWNLNEFFATYLQPPNVPPSNDVMNVPPSNDVICETTVEEEKVLSCSGCADTGIAWLAQCAREAMAETPIGSTLQEPVTYPENVATAYRAVITAGLSSGKAARLLRDLLVLTVCTNDGPWTNTSIKAKMIELFDNQESEVSDSLVSDGFMPQILHAYKMMHQAALNSQNFNKTVRALDVLDKTCPESLEDLLAAYIALYNTSPEWTSNTKCNGRPNRPAKAKHRMKRQLAADLESLRLSNQAERPARSTPVESE